jgi:hypothetical protein
MSDDPRLRELVGQFVAAAPPAPPLPEASRRVRARPPIVLVTLASLVVVGVLVVSLAVLPQRKQQTKVVGGSMTPRATASARPRSPNAVIFTCLGQPEVAPSMISACGDGNAGVKQLHWTEWGTARATSNGLRWANDCQPTCAQGHFHYYPAKVVVYSLGTISGRPAYTKLDVMVSGPHPSYVQDIEHYDLTCQWRGTAAEQRCPH